MKDSSIHDSRHTCLVRAIVKSSVASGEGLKSVQGSLLNVMRRDYNRR